MAKLRFFRSSRRYLLYKLIFLCTLLIFLLIWATQRQTNDLEAHYNDLDSLKHPMKRYSNARYEKAEQPVLNDDNTHVLPLPFPSAKQEASLRLKFTHEEVVRYEKELAYQDRLVVPHMGAKGNGRQPTAEEEESIKKDAFNLPLSNQIPMNRSIPDTRDPLCHHVAYDAQLPKASVIIVFTNEAWSSLIRTIHSVLNRTPKKYLQEILLIDDCSDKEELKGRLDYYVQTKLPNDVVRLVHVPQRQGLIRARLVGARAAVGDVLVFLDAHCETNVQWLEPLLQRIKEEPKAVVTPIIEVVDERTMEYHHGNGYYFQIGGFTWSGHFQWIDISPEEERRRGTRIAATRSPTMAGGLFAIDREYFWKIGSYDEGMDIWGGENLEMSFRVWQCGGYLETIPCSRVGHIFRSFHPYTFPGNKDTHGINTVRVVNVWMDSYSRLFYMNRPDLKNVDFGDISKRLELRKKLGCKSFRWFLNNIYSEKFIPDEQALAYGRVHNNATGLCLDSLQRDEKKDYFLGLYPCHTQLFAAQYFSLSKKNELRREEVCSRVAQSHFLLAKSAKITMARCKEFSRQEWIYNKNSQLVHKSSQKCLSAYGRSTGDDVTLETCARPDDTGPEFAHQQWSFDHWN